MVIMAGERRRRCTPDSVSLASSLTLDALERRKMKQIVDDLLQSRSSRQLLKMLSYQLIPLMALVVMCSILLAQLSQVHSSARLLQRVILDTDKIGDLVVSLQVERGLSAAFLSSNQSQHSVCAELRLARRNTDKVFNGIEHWLCCRDDFNDSGIDLLFNIRANFKKAIEQHRREVDLNTIEKGFRRSIEFYTRINTKLIEANVIESTKLEALVWHKLVAKQTLLLATDFYGIERALGTVFYVQCKLSTDDLQWFKTVRTQGNVMLNQAFNYYDQVRKEHIALLNDVRNAQIVVDKMRSEIDNNSETCAEYDSSQIEDRSLQWFRNTTLLINTLSSVRGKITQQMTHYVKTTIHNTNRTITLYSLFGASTILACIILSIFHALKSHSLLSSIGHYAKDLSDKRNELESERKLTLHLAYQMIPKDIAKRLQAGKPVEAKVFDAVTIFVSDIEGFAAISALSTPIEVVTLINNFYSICDDCIDKYNVYKAEMVGDAYMVVSGIPEPNDSNAYEIASMAVELLNVTQTLRIPHLPGEHIKIRIGIHTGPCVAGIVGIRMPRYCLFGDTVNTASIMESTGKGHKIHISEATLMALEVERRTDHFTVVPRGEIEIKGQSTLHTYWLGGARQLSGPKRQVEWKRSYVETSVSSV